MWRLLSWLAAIQLVASTPCNTWTHCDSCTQAASWVIGTKCGWCPDDSQCHEFLSTLNPCGLSSITKADKCNTPPPPPPPPLPKAGNTSKKILAALFGHLHITDVDVKACASDFDGAEVALVNFAAGVKSGQYSRALGDVSRSLSALSAAVANCEVPEVQQKLDVLAASLRLANISKVDHGIEVIVDASHLWDQLQALSEAVRAKGPDVVGQRLGALLDAWSAVAAGCADDQACKLIDGLLRVFQASLAEAAPCARALAPAVANMTVFSNSWGAGKYKEAAEAVAAALDGIAEVTATDGCGLKVVADAVGGLGEKLRRAVVKAESSEAAQIIVGSADVYTELYAIAADLKRGDFAGVGMQMGALLFQLRASGCSAKTCLIAEGILASLQKGFPDLRKCESSLDSVWEHVERFLGALGKQDSKQMMQEFRTVLSVLGEHLSQDCDAVEIGNILRDTAKHANADAIAQDIGVVVQYIIRGRDVTTDFSKMLVDLHNRQWAALGRDIGALSSWVRGTGCNSFTCYMLEGVLEQLSIPLQDFANCSATLRRAERDFFAGVGLWGHGDTMDAVKAWAVGLKELSNAGDACGLNKELAFIEQEANVLGIGNLTLLNKAAIFLVHGEDVYRELRTAFDLLASHDPRGAGKVMGKLMDQLRQWTTAHLCARPECYVVNGMAQYLAVLGADLHECELDASGAWESFGHAFGHLSGHRTIFSGFNRGIKNVTQGIHDLGDGLKDVADSVSRCHLEVLRKILLKLGQELGLPPELSFVVDFLSITINGVRIEKEVANVLLGYSSRNWPEFGYNLLALADTLLKAGPLTKTGLLMAPDALTVVV